MLGTVDVSAKGALQPDQLETKLSRDDIYRQRVFGNDSGWNSFIERQDTRRLSEAELLMYLLFMILCVWYSFERITVGDTFEVNRAINEAITEPLFRSKPLRKNWDDIVLQEDMREWLLTGLPEIVTPSIGEFNLPVTALRFTWRRPQQITSEVDRFKAYYPRHWDLAGDMAINPDAGEDEVEDRTSYGAYRAWEVQPGSTEQVASHLTWHTIQALACTNTELLDELSFSGVEQEYVVDTCKEWCEQLLAPKACRCWVLSGQYRCNFYHVPEESLLTFDQWSSEDSTQYQFIDQPEGDRVPPLEQISGVFSYWPTMRMFAHNGSSRGYGGHPGYVLTWPVYPDEIWYGDNGGRPVNITQERMVRNQIEDWFTGGWAINNSVSTLSLDMITFNPNYKMFSWVQMKFMFTKSATVDHTILVESLKLDDVDFSFFTDLGGVGGCYLVMVIGFTLLELFHMLNRSIPKYFAVWWNWVTIISLALHFSTIFLYMQYRQDSFHFAQQLDNLKATGAATLTDTDAQIGMFQNFDTQVHAYRIWLAVSAYNLLFLFFQLVHYLNDIFPSVRVLIHTMTHSVTPIFFLVILIGDILLSFVFAGNLIFGPSLQMFADFQTALTSCMELLFGRFATFHEMSRVKPILATLFFFFYMIIFKYIMENFARAIIILAYEDASVSFKQQKEDKALNQVVGENRAGNAYVGVILKRIRRALAGWSTDINRASARDMHKGARGAYQALGQTCLFAVFTTCYVTMVYFMIRPAWAHEMQRVASDVIERGTYQRSFASGTITEGNNYSSIVDRHDVMAWLEQALPQIIYGTSQGGLDGEQNPYSIYQSALPAMYEQAVMQNFNIFVGQHPVRLTLRWFEMQQGSTADFFSLLGIPENSSDTFTRLPVGMDERPVSFGGKGRPTPYDSFVEAKNLSSIVTDGSRSFLEDYCNYTSSAYGSTTDSPEGGWVCMLTVADEYTRELLAQLSERLVITQQTGTVAIDFVLFNGFAEVFAHVSVVFGFQPSGLVEKNIIVETIRLEYPGLIDFIIWVFAILVLLLNLLYLGQTLAALRNVIVFIQEIAREREQKDTGAADLKLLDKIILSIRTSVVFLLFDAFNLMDVVSSILTISGMVIWFEIYSSKLRTTYYFPERPEWNEGTCTSEGLTWCSDQEVLQLFYEMGINLRHFIRVQGINVCLIFFRFLKHCNFGRMGVLFSALRDGMKDIGVFVIVFFTILTGYVLCGLQLFGSYLEGFRNAGVAYRQCFDMFLGSFDYAAMREISWFNARVYFFSFMILFKYVIVNMFTAIMHLNFMQANKDFERMQQTKSVSQTSATADSSQTGFLRQVLASFKGRWIPDFGDRRNKNMESTDSANMKEYTSSYSAAGENGHDDMMVNGHENGHGNGSTPNGHKNGYYGSSPHMNGGGEAPDAIEMLDRDAFEDSAEFQRRNTMGYPSDITEEEITNKKWHYLPDIMKRWAVETTNEILVELDQLESSRDAALATTERSELDRVLEEAESKYGEKVKEAQKSADAVKQELERDELHGLKVVHQDQESLAWYIMKKEVEHSKLQKEMKHKQDRLEKMKVATQSLIDSSGALALSSERSS